MDSPAVNLRNRDDVKRIRQCRVVFSYKQDHEDELNLNVGDVIDILGEEEEGWWRGYLNGKQGVFPSNFVEEIVSPPPKSQQGSKENLADLTNNDTTPHPLTTPPHHHSNFTKSGKLLCEAKYPYKAQNEDELSLKEGDIVVLLSKGGQDPGWWKGELNGVVGVFPDNFVSIIPLLQDDNTKNSKDSIERMKPKSYKEQAAIIKPSSIVSSQRKSLDIQNIDKAQPSSSSVAVEQEPSALLTKASPPVPSKKPSIPIKKSPSSSGSSGIFQGLRKKIVDVVDGATGSKNVSPPKIDPPSNNNDNPDNAFDNVLRSSLLSDVRASRPKAPGRRLPTAIYKELEPGVMNGNTVEQAVMIPEVESSSQPQAPNSSPPEADSADGKPKLREWEKHKAPWLEEMKLNQAKRTSTSPGPPETKLKLTPTPTTDKAQDEVSECGTPPVVPLVNQVKTPPNELDKGQGVSILKHKANNVPITTGRPQTIHNINLNENLQKPVNLYAKLSPPSNSNKTPAPVIHKPQHSEHDRGSTDKIDGDLGDSANISQQRYLELLEKISNLEDMVKKQANEHALALDELEGKLRIETEMRRELQVKLENFLVDNSTIHQL